jgi:hypothetical protein
MFQTQLTNGGSVQRPSATAAAEAMRPGIEQELG